jgi:predicted ester cyclase
VTSDLKLRTQAIYDMFSTGDLSGVEELVATNLVDHEVVPGIGGTGPEMFGQLIGLFRSAFPDLSLEIIEMVEDGDRVAVQFRMSGTHEGEFLGIPPTHKAFGVTAFDIVRFEDGKAVEHWGQADDLAMLMQLGLIPPPPA